MKIEHVERLEKLGSDAGQIKGRMDAIRDRVAWLKSLTRTEKIMIEFVSEVGPTEAISLPRSEVRLFKDNLEAQFNEMLEKERAKLDMVVAQIKDLLRDDAG